MWPCERMLRCSNHFRSCITKSGKSRATSFPLQLGVAIIAIFAAISWFPSANSLPITSAAAPVKSDFPTTIIAMEEETESTTTFQPLPQPRIPRKRSKALRMSTRKSTPPTPSTAESPPHWVNPCPSQDGGAKLDPSAQLLPASEHEYMDSVLVVARAALLQAERFREQYVEKTFNVRFFPHHKSWKDKQYTWLRKGVEIPKDLGQQVPDRHWETVDMEEQVAKIFGFLQRLAVAFEQMRADHNRLDFAFKREFANAEDRLKLILCELRQLISPSKLATLENATRDVMGPEYRHMTNLSHQHLRDWFIFRDYMNVVEYIVQLMNYFKAKTL